MARATTPPRSPVLMPLLLIAVGLVLLVGSFLFVDNFNPTNLVFLLMAILGTIALLRGDLAPSTEARTFAITRGSVESATLTINAGDVDTYIGRLPTNDRLIAGQFAYNTRPTLEVEGTHATLLMDRAKTSMLTFADWEVALAPAMPWTIWCSASLGQIDADLSGLILDTAAFHSGISSVRIVAPAELLGETIVVRSILGNVHIQTPLGYNVCVFVRSGRFAKVHVNNTRYTHMEDGSYQALDAHPNAPSVTLLAKTTFGDIYLS